MVLVGTHEVAQSDRRVPRAEVEGVPGECPGIETGLRVRPPLVEEVGRVGVAGAELVEDGVGQLVPVEPPPASQSRGLRRLPKAMPQKLIPAIATSGGPVPIRSDGPRTHKTFARKVPPSSASIRARCRSITSASDLGRSSVA